MVFAQITDSSSDDPEDRQKFNKMMSMFGPTQVDHSIRAAIQMCWMMLPDDKKTPVELEATIRLIFDRAIQNFHEDSETFRKT